MCLQKVGETHDVALAELLAPACIRVCITPSHAGHTVLYIQPGLQPRAERPTSKVAIATIPLAAAAKACGLLALLAAGSGPPADEEVGGNSRIWVLGCHLIFGKDREAERVQQVEVALASLPPDARLVVLAGDTNFLATESAKGALPLQLLQLRLLHALRLQHCFAKTKPCIACGFALPPPFLPSLAAWRTVEALGLLDALCLLGCPRGACYTWDNISNDYGNCE